MAACSAFGCTNRPSKKIPGITFHRFPKNEELKAKWVKAVRRKNWIPSKYSVLCSKHFTEEMMDRTSLSYVRLRDNAVPTVFEIFPSYLKNGFYYQRQKSKKPSLNEHLVNITSNHHSPVKVCEYSDNNKEASEVSSKSPLNQKPTILTGEISFNNSATTKCAKNPAILEELSETSPAQQNISDSKNQLSSDNNSAILDEDSSRTLPVDRRQVSTNCNFLMKISNSIPCIQCQRALLKEQQAGDWRKKYQKKIKILQQKNKKYKKKIENLKSVLDGIIKKTIDYGSLFIVTE